MYYFLLSFLFISNFIFADNLEYFQQEVNYVIDVTLDDKKHELNGNIEIEYINNSPDHLKEIFFHLWPNAYQEHCTALCQQKIRNKKIDLYYASKIDRGYIDNLNFHVNGDPIKYELDKNNKDICKLILNGVIKSGDTIKITTDFRVKIPDAKFSRLGHTGQAYYITQWYPKPAVFDNDGWHVMPYLDQGEFYSEFGSFDVSITLPKNYVVGSTGDLQNQEEKDFLNMLAEKTSEIKDFSDDMSFPKSSDDFKTLRYIQNNIHDFAWFADKRYHVLKGEIELPHSKRKVNTWAMFTNNEADLWLRSIEYLNDATFYYSLWNGDYPYNHMTAVDGTIAAGGGMEYPNVTIIGESMMPFALETVIMHEVGHNWFYGVLGTNERDHAWMDEGINSFNELRYILTKYPERSLLEGEGLVDIMNRILGTEELTPKAQYELGYFFNAYTNKDQPLELTSEDYSEFNYWGMVYEKSAIVFYYLYSYLGEDLFDKCMKKYYETWKYKHPQPKDLRDIFQDVTGKDLDWFFDNLIKTTDKIDYKILGLNKSQNTVKIKNMGQVNSPFPITVIKNSNEKSTFWVEGFSGVKNIQLDILDYDKIKIDYFEVVPEINRNNNTYRKSFLPKIEPLKLQLLGSYYNPDKTQLFYAPRFRWWNKYDELGLGVSVYNQVMPKKGFYFKINPLYSFGMNNISGDVTFGYKHFPSTSNSKIFDSFIYSSNLERFAFGDDYYYNKYYDHLHIDFYKKDKNSFINKSIDFRLMVINEQYIGHGLNTFDLKKNTIFADLKFNYHYDHPINNYDYELSLNFGPDFLRTDIVSNFTVFNPIKISKFNSKIHFRFFASIFLKNNNSNYPLNLRYDSGADYLYDYDFLGRSETSGLFTRHIILEQGGFKDFNNIDNVFTNDLMISFNTLFPLIYTKSKLLPNISTYADFAFMPNAISDNPWDDGQKINFYYSFGLSIPIGALQFYVPVYNQNGFNSFTDFFGSLSYSVRLPNIEISSMLGLN